MCCWLYCPCVQQRIASAFFAATQEDDDHASQRDVPAGEQYVQAALTKNYVVVSVTGNIGAVWG